ncbi:hypothetical protein [Sphingobium yanoikuyae]|jgi:hypothetical protein|uniref:hypothetical protein n=1 Tax=Sphingobium yanoikuyae TaxID=13690 RepID=UPI0004E44FB5|nr:hypothetical protein [Sphingobium yanoikuyae]KFD30122.1 hypothetical protein IH86_01850 [Sphingobium yanoikuyae]MDV3477834.1 hypothetical protein [Sphingobium yanoikuyae]
MQTNGQSEALRDWLMKQTGRDDWIGTLANQTKAGLRFRAASMTEDLGKCLQEFSAEGDSFEALADAETEWQNA